MLFGITAVPVSAMEVVPLSGVGSNITLVAGGCGGGFHRGPNGGCRPNGGAVVAPAIITMAAVIAGGATG
jgi:hypothetical protein